MTTCYVDFLINSKYMYIYTHIFIFYFILKILHFKKRSRTKYLDHKIVNTIYIHYTRNNCKKFYKIIGNYYNFSTS